MDFGHISL